MTPPVPPDSRGRPQLETRVLCTPIARATAEGPPSRVMIDFAGSIKNNVAIFATTCKPSVSILETYGASACWHNRYMLNDWAKRALAQWDTGKKRRKNDKGQSDLARALTEKLGRNIDRAAVNKMVSDKSTGRDMAADEMIAIAEITKYPAPLPRITKPAIGYVGAGAEIVPFDDYALGAGLDEVSIPHGAPEDAAVVIVRGDSMYPRYFNGEYLLYTRDLSGPEDLVGQECVVRLTDGRMFVKVLRRGQRQNRFNLESWNAEPIENQEVEWAGPVVARLNRSQARFYL